MPESYRVDLKNPEQYKVVSDVFTDRPGVESVESQNQVLDRLFALLNQLKLGAWLLAAVTLLCSVLLVATTIRLTAFTRRRETGIMRLVGASNFFIQLPFILESMIAAAVGAVLASGALVAVTHFQIQGRLAKSLTFTNYVGVGDACRSCRGCSSSAWASLACRPSWRCRDTSRCSYPCTVCDRCCHLYGGDRRLGACG